MDSHHFKVDFVGKTYEAFYIKDPQDAALVVSKLMAKDCLFGLDTETMALPEYHDIEDAALSPHLSKIRLLQISDGERSFVFDMLFINNPSIFTEFLESKRFIAHNAVFDLMFLKKLGVKNINIGCTFLLTKLLFHAVYPTDEGLSGSLGAMVHTLFKSEFLKKEQTSDWSIPDLNFSQIEYSALDAIAVLRVAEKLAPGLTKFGLERIYTLTKEAQHPIAELQLNGILFDIERHRELLPIWRDKLYASKKELHALTGLDKFTSHTMAEWLSLNLPNEVLDIWPVTDTGKLSTDSHTFSDFSFLPIVKPFSEYQKKEKLLSTYGLSLISQVNKETGRLHAQYRLLGARTGRLSSSHPNLQNLPRETDIRSNFISGEGSTFICADYSQIELRVGAELSHDETMLEAYSQGIDLHSLTASQVSGKNIKDVTKDDRQMAKALNFGLMFGLGAKKFSHYARRSYGIEVPEEEATAAIRAWRELYGGYREWQLDQAAVAGETYVCRTPCGKLRRLPEDNTFGNSMNHPVQGGAAEVMLFALCKLNDEFKDTGIRLVNTVHDEILLQVPTWLAEEVNLNDVKTLVVQSMTNAFLEVFPNGITKNLVSVGNGSSWGDAK